MKSCRSPLSWYWATVPCVMNLQRRQQFQNNHRVLNHATRPNRAVSCISLQPTALLCSTGAAGIGLDEHMDASAGPGLPLIGSAGMPRVPVSRSLSKQVDYAMMLKPSQRDACGRYRIRWLVARRLCDQVETWYVYLPRRGPSSER